MLKKILPAFVATIFTASSVMAANAPALTFNAHNTSIDFVWDAKDVIGESVTVTITDSTDALSLNNYPDFIWLYDIPDDGIFDMNILLPKDIETGSCYLYLDGESNNDKIRFFVHNIRLDATVEACEFAYDIDTAEEFEIYANDNAAHLGIDTEDEDIVANSSAIYEALFYEMSRHSEKSPLVVGESAKISTGFVLIGTKNNVDDTIEKYGSVLSVDKTEFSKLSDDIKKKFTDLISKSNNTEKDIKTIVRECLILAKITSCENWDNLRTNILNNAEYIGIDIGEGSKYLKISSGNRYEVFTKLYDIRETIESLDGFITAFNNSVDAVYKAQKESGSSSGGSSGGASGGGSKIESSSVNVSESFLNNTQKPFGSNDNEQHSFSDLGGHFSEEYVNSLLRYNVVNGYPDGTFRPDNFVTRAEFAQMVVKLFGIEAKDNGIFFDDVSSFDWYYRAVMAASSNGIVSGYNSKYNPNEPIKRQDVAIIISNLLKYGQINTESYEPAYNDYSEISDYARDSVGEVTFAKIMEGDGGKFRPQDSVTRGEAAIVLSRLSKVEGLTAEVNEQ